MHWMKLYKQLWSPFLPFLTLYEFPNTLENCGDRRLCEFEGTFDFILFLKKDHHEASECSALIILMCYVLSNCSVWTQFRRMIPCIVELSGIKAYRDALLHLALPNNSHRALDLMTLAGQRSCRWYHISLTTSIPEIESVGKPFSTLIKSRTYIARA